MVESPPPCDIIQQHSQRCSHQSTGGVERMVQTFRNLLKAHKIRIEKSTGSIIADDSLLLTLLPRHAAWQYTRFHKRQGSTTPKSQSVISCIVESSFSPSVSKKINWARKKKRENFQVQGPNCTESAQEQPMDPAAQLLHEWQC